MRHLLSSGLIGLAIAIAPPALADDFATWNSPYGYNPGDEGNQVNIEGLNVSWVAERSYTEGRMRVVAEFCNNTRSDWEGGMRLTHLSPTRGHLTLRVPQGDCVTREEIIPTGVTDIYIYLNEY